MRNHSTNLLFIFLFIISSLNLLSQDRGPSQGGNSTSPQGAPLKATLKGQVIDSETKEPMEFATVTLYQTRDSSIIGGGITDETGKFIIDAKPGVFYAVVEFISYQSQVIENIRIGKDNLNVDLGVIGLSVESNDLMEVEVRAEKSEMTMSLDKRVFNVGKDLAGQGGTAEDILDNVPSVTVDVEGNVSLRGSSGVRILVDGKPSALISDGNANGLRQIQGNMIERIEVVTNPSARYEAEGMAGIINIVLKKNRKKGFNGSFDVTTGAPNNHGIGFNLNYRKNRFNWFTNLGLRYRTNPGFGTLYQELYRRDANGNIIADSTSITDMVRETNRGGLSGNFRFGADYYFSPKSILTTAFSYRISDENNSTELEYNDFFGNLNNPVLTTLRTDDETEDETDLEYSLTYKRLFDRKGQEFTVDLRIEEKLEKEGSTFIERYFDSENNALGIPNFNQRSNNEEGETRIALQMDYVHPFAEEGKFEIGYRGSFRRIDNDYLVEEELESGIWTTDFDFTNNFVYDENIQAVYAIFGNKHNKFSYQFGLRGELSDVKTELKTTNEINDRTYANLFPSLHLTYELKEDNAFQVSYSRRVRRPRFWDLNPFFTLSDRRNFFSGNPNLDPEFTDSYEIGHIKYWEKGSLSSSIYYRKTEGVIERIRRIDEDNPENTLTQPENLSTRDDYGFEFTYSYKPVKWWRMNGDFNFFRSITEGTYVFGGETVDLYGEALTMTANMTTRATLWKAFDLQIRGSFRAPRTTTQGKRKASGSLDIGASIDVLKKNGTLTLSGRDIFQTRRRRYITFDDNFFSEGDFRWRSRQVTLTLNYRINQKKRRGGGRRGGGGYGGGGEGEF